MSEVRRAIDHGEDIRRAIRNHEMRAGFESDRARTWGWFMLVRKEDVAYWEWVSSCSPAEKYLFDRLFADGEIDGEPCETSTGMCILAA